MDIDQLIKKVEWLDDERRSDKTTISDLQKKIAQLEGTIAKSEQEKKDLSSEITRLGVLVGKVDEFDKTLNNLRAELKKELDAADERAKRREKTAKTNTDGSMEGLRKDISSIDKQLDEVKKMKQELLSHAEARSRLERLMNEMDKKVAGVVEQSDERQHGVRTMQEDLRQENKRITDIQGELTALRKRADEQKAKVEVNVETQRKIDARLNELVAAESERRESQAAFVDKITATQNERDREWKNWSKRFEQIERQSQELAETLQNVGDTERAVKRAQEAFEAITDQINRRINEITEMQRLGEERFRQEWATFRADDQKRWTNYMLTQEEQQKEVGRQLERLTTQTTELEDTLQELQDIVQQISDQNERHLQTLLANLRDWVNEAEQLAGTR